MTTPNIRELQAPLRERYTEDPSSAIFTLKVTGGGGDLHDPLHATISPESTPDAHWRSGAHPAVGGLGDVPCSGDLLLGALAACQEVTIRMVAANMHVELAGLEIIVEGDWDARGTLAMGDFPIGLTAIRCATTVTLTDEVNPDRAERLLRSAEKYCVVLNTLQGGVDVESTFAIAR